jgi:transmembrane sensor
MGILETASGMQLGGDRFSERRRDADTRAAATWLARWQAGTVDEEDFARWRDADPAHALAFARVTAAWEAADGSGALGEADDRFTRRRMMRGAAVGAVLVAAGSGLVATRAYAWDSASTRVGERRRIALPDGSSAMLNTDSELAWRFSSSRRELWLKRGEVAIDLGAGPAASLATEGHAATLQPGRFNARLKDDAALGLTVLRGAATGEGGTRAGAYQQLSFAGAAASVQPVARDAVENVLAWQNGDIVFVDTPLAEAVSEYNRYLDRKIVIDDPAVGSIRIGGRFLSSNPADFLTAVSAGLGVRVQHTDAGTHLRK